VIRAAFKMLNGVVTALQHLERRISQLSRQLISLLAEANHCHMLAGRHVTVRVGDAEVSGLCLGIDDAGNLVLRGNAQIHRLPSGVVQRWTEPAI
jgi:biotin-(acetyl-CoA carboxylase) ligase